MNLNKYPNEKFTGSFLGIDHSLYSDKIYGVAVKIVLDINLFNRICIEFDKYAGFKIISPYYLYVVTKPENGNDSQVKIVKNIKNILVYSKLNLDSSQYFQVEKFFMERI